MEKIKNGWYKTGIDYVEKPGYPALAINPISMITRSWTNLFRGKSITDYPSWLPGVIVTFPIFAAIIFAVTKNA